LHINVVSKLLRSLAPVLLVLTSVLFMTSRSRHQESLQTIVCSSCLSVGRIFEVTFAT